MKPQSIQIVDKTWNTTPWKLYPKDVQQPRRLSLQNTR